MRRTHIRNFAAVPTALVLTALLLTGCSAARSSYESAGSGGGVSDAQQAPVAASDGSIASTTDVNTVDRQVIETGYATVVVTNPADAADEAVKITESTGGRVDGRNETAPTEGNQGSATLTLRIPASALTATLDKLKALGTVQEVSLSSSDVTMQSQDLDAQIKALSASVDRLITLEASATDIDTLIKLETAISDRQGQLDSLTSQQRYLADQVAMSTLTLNLVSEAQAVVVPPSNFFSGLAAGWNAFVGFFAGLLVVFGVLLPWLVLAAIIAFVVIVLVRRHRTSNPVGGPAAAPTSVAAGE